MCFYVSACVYVCMYVCVNMCIFVYSQVCCVCISMNVNM